ncbi:MAG: phosphotransferase [Fimbriimonadaceae bacterium]|nr:phosphotransferase [Fimbriimonadaceae bacterium]
MDCSTSMASHAVVRNWSLEPTEAAECEVARVIASQFDVGLIQEVERFRERGNINLHTFRIRSDQGDFLLQRLNTEVFAFPDRVMSAMEQWTVCQRTTLKDRPEITWEPITLVSTVDRKPFLRFRIGGQVNVWRLMVQIPDVVTFKSLSELPNRAAQLALAEQVGRGLALNADLTADLDTDRLQPSLLGYRDTFGYYAQFESVLGGHRDMDSVAHLLPESEELRAATASNYVLSPGIGDAEAESRRMDPTLRPFIELAQQAKEHGLTLAEGVRTGWLRRTPIHGDTKIDNFLFDRETLAVRSLIDLDTIMPYTWLADWGDCVRSLCNVAGEKERNLDSVQVDREIYQAVASGFLGTTERARTEEIALMVDAVEVIALELGLRFLTDYLRGDNYFALGTGDAPDLNKVRAMVQLTLFKRLRDARPALEAIVAQGA